MTLKDLKILTDALINLGDFMEANSDGDESGISNEIGEKYNQAMSIIDKERYRLYLRNALAKNKRKLKNKQFGIVYIDKHGRQSQVFSSDSTTKFIDKSKKN